MSETGTNCNIGVGLLHRRGFRKSLDDMKAKGHLREWIEVRGALESQFRLLGLSPDALSAIDHWVAA